MLPELSSASEHGLFSCAAEAGPPSPVKPALPVPAIVEIVNPGGACAWLAADVPNTTAPARVHTTIPWLHSPPVTFFLIKTKFPPTWMVSQCSGNPLDAVTCTPVSVSRPRRTGNRMAVEIG